MKKSKKVFLCFVLVCVGVLISIVFCCIKFSSGFGSKEIFCENIDGHGIALEKGFFIMITYGEKVELYQLCNYETFEEQYGEDGISLYKKLDRESFDFVSKSKLYYSGLADRVYQSSENIIIFSEQEKTYYIVDIKDRYGTTKRYSLDEMYQDLSNYTEIILNNHE